MFRSRQLRSARRGFTLVEMLVAMTLTLLMMATVVTIFDLVGRGVAESRTILEMSNSLRTARDLLQSDLSGATCRMMPGVRPEENLGCFSYIEGPRTDNSRAFFLSDPPPDPPPVWAPTSIGNNPDPPLLVDRSQLGDFDDMLHFTVKSPFQPFVGRVGAGANPGVVQSQFAEVIWYCVENPAVPATDPDYLGIPGLRTLYRRILLVQPILSDGVRNAIAGASAAELYENFDLSLKANRTPNESLGDLTMRENRTFHHPANFPHPYPMITNTNIGFSGGDQISGSGFLAAGFRQGMMVSINGSQDNDGIRRITNVSGDTLTVTGGQLANEAAGRWVTLRAIPILTGGRTGDDIVLRNVVAFDVRAYDPQAPIRQNSQGKVAVAPGDPGWALAPATNLALGAYVDLNYSSKENAGADPGSWFSGPPQNPSASHTYPNGIYDIWDTWPLHYEYDGVDQDGDGVNDQGTNGLDNGGNNAAVDDPGERETQPPYGRPLRGVQVTIRIYEPDTRQIRQATVIQNFVLE